MISPVPSQEAVALGPVLSLSRSAERAGWPPIDLIDLRAEDPRGGLFHPRIIAAARAAHRPVFVLNRTGRSRLSICRNCSATATCERCDAAVSRLKTGIFTCPRCAHERPEVCLACRGTAFANLRLGVSRVVEEASAPPPTAPDAEVVDAACEVSVVVHGRARRVRGPCSSDARTAGCVRTSLFVAHSRVTDSRLSRSSEPRPTVSWCSICSCRARMVSLCSPRSGPARSSRIFRW